MAAFLLAPIGNQVAHASEALTWGTLTPDKPGGYALPSKTACVSPIRRMELSPRMGQKGETRGGKIQTADLFAMPTKQRAGISSLFRHRTP